MRHTRSTLHRALWAVLALVQLSVLAGGVWVDATVDRSGVRVAHIESEAGDDCHTGHDHLFCQSCRTLVLEAAGPSLTWGAWFDAGATGVLSATQTDLPTAAPRLSRPLGSRAPPRA